jgi:hypothetical protein
LRGDRFVFHCVASQAVWLCQKSQLTDGEMPANGGLLRFLGRSLDSRFNALRPDIAESLRTSTQIFPFFGRLALETGFDRHWMAGSAVQSATFSVWVT